MRDEQSSPALAGYTWFSYKVYEKPPAYQEKPSAADEDE
jgi:hypothetical protein